MARTPAPEGKQTKRIAPISRPRDLARLAFLCLALGLPIRGFAQPALIIADDHGGTVSTRVSQIAQLRRSGRAVEIRGEHCYSSCTMYLALPRLCIHPDTIFGFHGPSDFGKPLLPQQFEYWSRIIADHYPPSLADWYMRVARHSLSRHHNIRGKDLARHYGIDLCPGARLEPPRPKFPR